MTFARVASLLPLLLASCAGEGGASESVPGPVANAPADAPEAARAGESLTAPVTQPARTQFAIEGELEQGGWIRGRAPEGATGAALGGTALSLDADGYFFAAFDRDAGGSERLSATLEDGSVVSRDLSIRPRDWDIERVNVARRPSGSSEAFLRIRRPELARIVAARAVGADSDGWRQDFIWPVTGRISGRFGSQRIYRGEPGSYHSGIDISTGTSGTPFVAPADGVVVLAADEEFSLEGKLLIIDHGQGLNSAFLHCASLAVEEGDVVRQGQVIGTIGSSGRATGPHLHWGIKWRDARLDPLLFTGPMR